MELCTYACVVNVVGDFDSISCAVMPSSAVRTMTAHDACAGEVQMHTIYIMCTDTCTILGCPANNVFCYKEECEQCQIGNG